MPAQSSSIDAMLTYITKSYPGCLIYNKIFLKLYYQKLYDFCNWNMSCKCVRSTTNRSGPLNTKEKSVISSHIVDCSIDSYVF